VSMGQIRLVCFANLIAFVLVLGGAPPAAAITVGPVTVPDPDTSDVGKAIPPQVPKLPLVDPRQDPPPGGGGGTGGGTGGGSGGSSGGGSTTNSPPSTTTQAPSSSTSEGGSGSGSAHPTAEAAANNPPAAGGGQSPVTESTDSKHSRHAAHKGSTKNGQGRASSTSAAGTSAPVQPGGRAKHEDSSDPSLIERLTSPIPKEYRLAVFLIAGVALVLGGISMREHRRSRRALRHALSDSLTTLPNRKAFELRLESEWKRAERYDRPLGMLLMDLDDFKQINDTQGHAAGDRALRNVAEVIGGQVRDSDMAARLSGDEFVALCPETPVGELEPLAEKIEVALRRLGIKVSIGYAERQSYDRGPADLVDRADAAMYREKDRRRLLAAQDPAPALGA
jgi:diguanylate cyclase (GGDEF)-like protein